MPNDSRGHVAKFTSADVCKAAGITLDTLKNWVSRKPPIVLLGAHDLPGGSRGVPNLFSLNRVLQIAIMAELTRLGWAVRPAALAAIQFTDIGETVASYGSQEPPPMRLPGCLFADGQTLLVARPADDPNLPSTKVFNVQSDASFVGTWTAIREELPLSGNRMAVGATVLDLSEIVARVRGVLAQRA